MTKDAQSLDVMTTEAAPKEHSDGIMSGAAEPATLWTTVAKPTQDRRGKRFGDFVYPHRRRVVAIFVMPITVVGVFALRSHMLGGGTIEHDAGNAVVIPVSGTPVSTSATSQLSQPLTTETSAPAPTMRQAFKLSKDFASKCRVAPALDADAQLAVVCEVGEGPMRVELRKILDGGIRSARLGELARRPVPTRGESMCAHGRPESRTWARQETPDEVSGVFGCQVIDGRAEIVWTDDAMGLVGRAVAQNSDLSKLFVWWAEAAPGASIP